MVEAVGVAIFFVVVFALMVFVNNLYTEKHRTLRVATERSWAYAMKSCEGETGEGVSTESGGMNPMQEAQTVPGGQDINTSDTDDFANSGDESSQLLKKDSGYSTATIEGSVKAAPVVGGFTKEVSTTIRVPCNEKHVDGNVFKMLKYAWDTKSDWL